MRLIDADEFIKKFRYSEAETDDEKNMCAAVRRLIREEPMAYDMARVEEQLEAERSKAIIRLSENKGTAYEFADRCTLDAYEEAIKIVKGGWNK